MRYLGLPLRGLIIWLVPFIISVPFYTPDRELVTSYALFKSVMALALALTTIGVALVRPPSGSPALAGAVYLLVNLALDALVLLPLTGLAPPAYLEQIGLLYLIIPAITYAVLARRAPAPLPAAR